MLALQTRRAAGTRRVKAVGMEPHTFSPKNFRWKTRCLIVLTFLATATFFVLPLYPREESRGGQTKITDTGSQIMNRKNLLKEKCKSVNDTVSVYSDLVYRLIIYQPKKMLMCYVPKTGCTFWKQVFYALQSQDKHSTESKDIFKANKFLVHYKPLRRLWDITSFGQMYQLVNEARKMILVRDPYARLFSAYVDKLLLPEFWSDIGTKIVRQIRAHADPLAIRCGHDVTFEEFLKRVVVKAQADMAIKGDEHWHPVFKLCHPCVFAYDIIGKQETFASDKEWIMKTLGIEDIQPEDVSWEESIVTGMEQSIHSAWVFKPTPPCLNVSLITQRLWEAFKLQGYIHHNMAFPFASVVDFNSLKKAVRSLRKLAPTKEEFLRRRKTALIQAYNKIPNDLMAKVREVFKYDFLLFGYDTKPEQLYGHRSDN